MALIAAVKTVDKAWQPTHSNKQRDLHNLYTVQSVLCLYVHFLSVML